MSMSLHEMIKVIEAKIKGDAIQSRTIGNTIWMDDENPHFGFDRVEFRIKPQEPIAHYRWLYTRDCDGKYLGSPIFITNFFCASADEAKRHIDAAMAHPQHSYAVLIIGPCESTKIMR